MRPTSALRDLRVSVRPAAGGWLINSAVAEPMFFFSGAQAEAKAHRLGQTMAGAGADVLVEVHDRKDRIVGRTRYFGDA